MKCCFCQNCCEHGGLIIYVHKEYECTTLTEVKVPSSGREYLCVILSHRKPKSKMYVQYNIYRKPNEIVNDLDNIHSFIICLFRKHSPYKIDHVN